MEKNSQQTSTTVLLIVDGLPAGGLERQIVELLKGLKQNQKVKTIICALSKGGYREKEAYEWADDILYVHQAANAGLSLLIRYPFIAVETFLKCRYLLPDVVHTYGCYSDVFGVLIAKIFHIPFINGSIRAARPMLNWRDRISRITFQYADKIIANSYAGLQSFGLQEEGLVIRNGVDQNRFQNVKPAVVDGFPVLCMVGNFTAKKDQHRLVSCLPVLKKQYENLQLVLVGRGKRIRDVKKHAERINCLSSIEFIDDCNDPESYIAAADICLLISNVEVHGEGISNAIIEYMALGKVVIASDCGGNSELVINGKTGFLVKSKEPEQLIACITHLLSDPKLALKMGIAGRQRIRNDFTIARMVTEYEKLYCELTKKSMNKV